MHQPKNFKTSLDRTGLSIRAFFLSILLMGSVLTFISALASEQIVFAQGSPRMYPHHLTSVRPLARMVKPLAIASAKKDLMKKGKSAPLSSKRQTVQKNRLSRRVGSATIDLSSYIKFGIVKKLSSTSPPAPVDANNSVSEEIDVTGSLLKALPDFGANPPPTYTLTVVDTTQGLQNLHFHGSPSTVWTISPTTSPTVSGSATTTFTYTGAILPVANAGGPFPAALTFEPFVVDGTILDCPLSVSDHAQASLSVASPPNFFTGPASVGNMSPGNNDPTVASNPSGTFQVPVDHMTCLPAVVPPAPTQDLSTYMALGMTKKIRSGNPIIANLSVEEEIDVTGVLIKALPPLVTPTYTFTVVDTTQGLQNLKVAPSVASSWTLVSSTAPTSSGSVTTTFTYTGSTAFLGTVGPFAFDAPLIMDGDVLDCPLSVSDRAQASLSVASSSPASTGPASVANMTPGNNDPTVASNPSGTFQVPVDQTTCPTVIPTVTVTSTVTVTPGPASGLTISNTHLGGDTFQIGQTVTSNIVVSTTSGVVPLAAPATTAATSSLLSLDSPLAVPNGITVTDSLPIGYSNVTAAGTDWSVTLNPATGTSPLVITAVYTGVYPVPAGTTLPTIVVTGTLNASATPNMTNSASVSMPGSVGTPVATSNDSFIVGPALLPALAIIKTNLDGDHFKVGDEVKYIIVVSNTGGPVVAPNAITVSDVIPVGLKDIHVDASQWDITISNATSPAIIDADYTGLFPVASGQVLSPIVITGKFTADAVPSLTNSATVDPLGNALANNSATDTVLVEKNENNHDHDHHHHDHHHGNGSDGDNGSNGDNGSDGHNGKNGKNGKNGTDGTNGTNGSAAPFLPGTGGAPLER